MLLLCLMAFTYLLQGSHKVDLIPEPQAESQDTEIRSAGGPPSLRVTLPTSASLLEALRIRANTTDGGSHEAPNLTTATSICHLCSHVCDIPWLSPTWHLQNLLLLPLSIAISCIVKVTLHLPTYNRLPNRNAS